MSGHSGMEAAGRREAVTVDKWPAEKESEKDKKLHPADAG